VSRLILGVRDESDGLEVPVHQSVRPNLQRQVPRHRPGDEVKKTGECVGKVGFGRFWRGGRVRVISPDYALPAATTAFDGGQVIARVNFVPLDGIGGAIVGRDRLIYPLRVADQKAAALPRSFAPRVRLDGLEDTGIANE
jgi:hypothetical protein